MFAARDQENLTFHRQNNAAMKQLQKAPGARYPKTPIKVPLNDENATHTVKGAKSIAGPRARGNENALTTKSGKGMDKSNFVTPMPSRSRAVLGDKTTNAKAQGMQSGNVKSAARKIEQTTSKVPATSRPKQKQAQAETQKLQIHAEVEDPLSEEEPEYCPPRPVDLPYESDVFPDGVLNFDVLKPENMFKGYYQHYFNPIDEDGVSKSDKALAESTRKALIEGERKIKEDMDSFQWATEREILEENSPIKKTAKMAVQATAPAKHSMRRPLASRTNAINSMSKKAASSLALDDTTKSLQRRAAATATKTNVPTKKTGFVIPRLASTKASTNKVTTPTARSTLERKRIEADSRATIGFNKGRSTASILNSGTTRPSTIKPRPMISRFGTAASTDSNQTITPARFAKVATSIVDEDAEWKERVPFLSIFSQEEEDGDFDLLGGQPIAALDASDDEDFEIRVLE